MSDLLALFNDLMTRGGWVMWPLLVLSIVSFTLMFERAWFWLRTNRPGRMAQVRRACEHLRRGDFDGASKLVAGDGSVYGRTVAMLVDETKRSGKSSRAAVSDALAGEIIESQRPRLERFMPALSTIITAAPLLGILGTVTGIIASFDLLSKEAGATDPRAVSGGIAEALLTTAAGLVVAILVLFPYNAFRAQIDRTLGRIETIIASAMRGAADVGKNDKP